jgi:hypothetical protein
VIFKLSLSSVEKKILGKKTLCRVFGFMIGTWQKDSLASARKKILGKFWHSGKSRIVVVIRLSTFTFVIYDSRKSFSMSI